MTGGDLLWKLWRDERVRRELAERRNLVIESPEYVFLVHPTSMHEVVAQSTAAESSEPTFKSWRREWRGLWILGHPGVPQGEVRLVRTAAVAPTLVLGARDGATP